MVDSLIVLTGSDRRFERITIALSLSLFAFVILAIGQHPDPRVMASGLLPVAGGVGSGYLGLVVALAGASVMPWMLFYQQAATVEKGLRARTCRRPAARRSSGRIASQLLMVAIVVAAATATVTVGSSVAPAIASLAFGGSRDAGLRPLRRPGRHRAGRGRPAGPRRHLAVVRVGLGRALRLAAQPRPL